MVVAGAVQHGAQRMAGDRRERGPRGNVDAKSKPPGLTSGRSTAGYVVAAPPTETKSGSHISDSISDRTLAACSIPVGPDSVQKNQNSERAPYGYTRTFYGARQSVRFTPESGHSHGSRKTSVNDPKQTSTFGDCLQKLHGMWKH